MTKWIIGVLVLVVLGGGAYWVYQANEGEGMMQEESMVQGATTSDMMHDDSMSSSTDVMVNVNASSTDAGMQDDGVMAH